MQNSKSPPVLMDAVITPISPFKPATRLLPPNKNNNALSTQCLLIYAFIHLFIAITLIVLYIEALIQTFMYANLLCYQENGLGTIPCNAQDKELKRVYTTSILDIITDSWTSKDYHISLLLLFASFIFPFIHIVNNLRMAFKQNTSINVTNNQSLCSSVFFLYLSKLSMIYIFGCILFINGLYQSTSTVIMLPPATLYQEIVIEADIAVNILIIAVVITSIWTVYVQYGFNNHQLFGHHRYIQYDNHIVQLFFVAFLIILAGIGVIVTYFMKINFIEILYNDDWNLYDTIFDDNHRKYDFISVIQDIKNKNNQHNNVGLTVFYYLYVVTLPIICCIGYMVLCLALRCYNFEIKKVILMSLFYVFLCFNGLDILIISSFIFKYVLPLIWQSIIDDIYYEFCLGFPVIGNETICDNLSVDITLKSGMLIGCIFIIVLLTIFCLINDFKCSKNIYSRYKTRTDTWDYRLTKSSTIRNSINDTDTTESDRVRLSRLVVPYSSTDNTQ